MSRKVEKTEQRSPLPMEGESGMRGASAIGWLGAGFLVLLCAGVVSMAFALGPALREMGDQVVHAEIFYSAIRAVLAAALGGVGIGLGFLQKREPLKANYEEEGSAAEAAFKADGKQLSENDPNMRLAGTTRLRFLAAEAIALLVAPILIAAALLFFLRSEPRDTALAASTIPAGFAYFIVTFCLIGFAIGAMAPAFARSLHAFAENRVWMEWRRSELLRLHSDFAQLRDDFHELQREVVYQKHRLYDASTQLDGISRTLENLTSQPKSPDEG